MIAPPGVPVAELPSWSWLLAAAGGAVVTALAGWVLVAGLAVVGWVTSEPGTLGEALVSEPSCGCWRMVAALSSRPAAPR